MAKDWKEISDDEILNFDDAHTGNMARYGRIMQMRSTQATVGLRDKITGLIETIYRASQALQEKADGVTASLDSVGRAMQTASIRTAGKNGHVLGQTRREYRRAY